MRKRITLIQQMVDDKEDKNSKKRKSDDIDFEDFISGNDEKDILDPITPTIYLSGEITSATAKSFRNAVRELDFERKSDIALIVIDSVGGEVNACFEMLNIMKASKIEFMTYNISHAYSCGAVMLSAGSKGKRFAAPLSHSMIHPISAGTGGSLPEMKNDVKHFDAANRMLLGELCRNCGITTAQLEDRFKANGHPDLFLSPQEAKELGLVDEVGCVSLTQAKAYQLEFITEEEEEEPKKESAPAEPKKKPTKKPAKKAPVKAKTPKRK